jgi:hypothetical protein
VSGKIIGQTANSDHNANKKRRKKMKLKSLALSLGFAVLAAVSMSAQTSYNFRTINYPHDTFTQLLGINVKGEIAGYHNVNDNKGLTYELSTKKFKMKIFLARLPLRSSASTGWVGRAASMSTRQASLTVSSTTTTPSSRSIFREYFSTNCSAATTWRR